MFDSDLDHLLRGLTHGSGVEVVMSMEDSIAGGGLMPGDINDVEFDRGGMYIICLQSLNLQSETYHFDKFGTI